MQLQCSRFSEAEVSSSHQIAAELQHHFSTNNEQLPGSMEAMSDGALGLVAW
jgi:hypothetical protein